MSKPQLIKDVVELKQLASRDFGVEVSIQLRFGLVSTKYVSFKTDRNKFYVQNQIDDTEQWLTEKQLWTKSNIGEALDKKALWWRKDLE